ncbi:RecB family exonuclease [Schaalia sp. lx-100]|uniref:RecB family exonuclease n=1 Tax=Schaalia sp. lx-100 TaxID=2899081 RepID=UPI001E4650CD|nr:PD-(D/E)XK nuclease family protein [Schaalia sp. lx-100]MCD4558160.1 PD-(D/E)XK nuclease family protein [Schaalia sp. lx-100]
MARTKTWEPALSASRAKEYRRCPLQYRLHVVDGFTDPPTHATAMGTLIHSVLEDLFDLPAHERTVTYAQKLLSEHWQKTCEETPEVLSLFPVTDLQDDPLAQVRSLISSYFDIEKPQHISPVAREYHAEAVTPGGVRLRGFIDRIDRSPEGLLRVVDYKTGKAPAPRFVEDALYQMRFYALLLMLKDRFPARLQLVYLRSGRVLTLDPEREDIIRFGKDVETTWASIEKDAHQGVFTPRPNPLCQWCGVRFACPEFGGVVPELSEEKITRLLSTRISTSTRT